VSRAQYLLGDIVKEARSIKVENVVTLELIDRNTGKVVERKVSKNTIAPAGAFAIVYLINGQTTDANTIKNWKYFYLFGSGKNLIKYIEGSWSPAEDIGGYIRAILTAHDSSSDAYTTNYQGIYWRNDATSLSQMGLYQTQSITKAEDKILKATWEVRAPYTTP
jgi:hypothetical protein